MGETKSGDKRKIETPPRSVLGGRTRTDELVRGDRHFRLKGGALSANQHVKKEKGGVGRGKSRFV